MRRAWRRRRGSPAFGAVIVMPADAPAIKRQRTERSGARVVALRPRHARTARPIVARDRDEEERLAFVHPYNDPFVIAGQGTVGLEIAEDCAARWAMTPDVVLVPCSGGGLSAGVALAVKERFPEAAGLRGRAARLRRLRPLARGRRAAAKRGRRRLDLRCAARARARARSAGRSTASGSPAASRRATRRRCMRSASPSTSYGSWSSRAAPSDSRPCSAGRVDVGGRNGRRRAVGRQCRRRHARRGRRALPLGRGVAAILVELIEETRSSSIISGSPGSSRAAASAGSSASSSTGIGATSPARLPASAESSATARPTSAMRRAVSSPLGSASAPSIAISSVIAMRRSSSAMRSGCSWSRTLATAASMRCSASSSATASLPGGRGGDIRPGRRGPWAWRRAPA